MRRKRKQSAQSQPTAAAEFHHQPFRQLKVAAAARPASPPVPPKPAARLPPAPPADDAALFFAAVSGARRLSDEERERVDAPPPAMSPRAVSDPEAEALAELCELVAGSAPFDLSDSDEYVEGHVVGADPRLVRRLRNGEFAYQAHIDLHGLTRQEAKLALNRFLLEACQNGKRCVLIVHGRGLNSKDQIPVLKHLVTHLLARTQWSRQVLAFTSARPYDGGAGAVYVLLRQHRETRQAFRVTNGAKL
ncbi:MAG TPA: Smr/MutS family protein [Terriglobales bacterium]|nr:Smr/MutS family protein [Terriglobales bacterium]